MRSGLLGNYKVIDVYNSLLCFHCPQKSQVVDSGTGDTTINSNGTKTCNEVQ